MQVMLVFVSILPQMVLFTLDAVYTALQPAREIKTPEMVYYTAWKREEKDHPRNCADYFVSQPENEQFCWLERPQACLQKVWVVLQVGFLHKACCFT